MRRWMGLHGTVGGRSRCHAGARASRSPRWAVMAGTAPLPPAALPPPSRLCCGLASTSSCAFWALLVGRFRCGSLSGVQPKPLGPGLMLHASARIPPPSSPGKPRQEGTHLKRAPFSMLGPLGDHSRPFSPCARPVPQLKHTTWLSSPSCQAYPVAIHLRAHKRIEHMRARCSPSKRYLTHESTQACMRWRAQA